MNGTKSIKAIGTMLTSWRGDSRLSLSAEPCWATPADSPPAGLIAASSAPPPDASWLRIVPRIMK
jgi:hypothetical protein